MHFNSTPAVVGANCLQSRDPEQCSSLPSFRRLLMLNMPEWRNAVFGCLGALCFGAIQPSFGFALGSLISVYFQNDKDEIKSKTRIYSFIFVFLSIFSLLVNMVQHYNFGVMGEYLTRRVRERMLSKVLTFEVSWFDQEENSTGAICSRMANDAYVVSIRKQLIPVFSFCQELTNFVSSMVGYQLGSYRICIQIS